MFYKPFELKDILENDEDKQVIDLLNNQDAHLKLVSINKDNGFDALIQHTDVFIYTIEGQIEITFFKNSCSIDGCCEFDGINDNSKQYIIKQNQMFMFEKEITHSIKALKNSVFLLAKI